MKYTIHWGYLSGAVWCEVYKDGSLVNEYDMYDEFQRQEVEHEI